MTHNEAVATLGTRIEGSTLTPHQRENRLVALAVYGRGEIKDAARVVLKRESR